MSVVPSKPSDFLQKFGKAIFKRPSGGQGFDPSSLSQGLNSLQGQQSNPVDDLMNQMMGLEMDAIDSQGGGGNDGGAGFLQAQLNQGVNNLTNFQNIGTQKIDELYASLGQYLQNNAQDVSNIYGAQTADAKKAYADAAAAIAQQGTNSNQELAKQGQLSPDQMAATAAVEDQSKNAIGRQASINQTNQANALANIANMSAGQQAIAKDLISGAATTGAAQKSKFIDQIGAQLGQLQNDMSAKIASAKASAASSGQNTRAAKDQVLEKFLGMKLQGLQNQQKSLDPSKLKGINGVIQYAQAQGHPELAQQFIQMLNDSRVNAAGQNTRDKANPAIGKATTSPEEQLQQLIGASGGDTSMSIDNLAPLLKNDPQLKKFAKYLIESPDQAVQQGVADKVPGWQKIIDAFDKRSGGQFRQKINSGQINLKDFLGQVGKDKGFGAILGRGLTPWYSQPDSNGPNSLYNTGFTPFLNLDPNSSDFKTIQQILQQRSQNSDQLNTLYDIYKGNYG